jgi:hypothetical protein
VGDIPVNLYLEFGDDRSIFHGVISMKGLVRHIIYGDPGRT